MNPTRLDLSADVRLRVLALLEPALQAAVDLLLQAKFAHWNVRGANFRSLHELFDEVAEAAEEAADEVAERIVQLGGTANALPAVVAATTPLPPYPTGAATAAAHTEAVATALAAFARHHRAAVDAAAAAGDAITADLLTEVTRGADKLLWMVEAHLG